MLNLHCIPLAVYIAFAALGVQPGSPVLPTAASQGSHGRETESAVRTGFLVESAVGGMDRKRHVVFAQCLDL